MSRHSFLILYIIFEEITLEMLQGQWHTSDGLDIEIIHKECIMPFQDCEIRELSDRFILQDLILMKKSEKIIWRRGKEIQQHPL